VDYARRGDDRQAPRAAPVNYLTFNVNRLLMACPVDVVAEVMGPQPILPVAEAPPYLQGAIRVHRRLIAVLSLRCMLGMPARPLNRRNSILLVRIGRGSRAVLAGLLVDSVSELALITPDQVRLAAHAPAGMRSGLVMGTVRIRGRLTRLIDVNALLTSEELSRLTLVAA